MTVLLMSKVSVGFAELSSDPTSAFVLLAPQCAAGSDFWSKQLFGNHSAAENSRPESLLNASGRHRIRPHCRATIAIMAQKQMSGSGCRAARGRKALKGHSLLSAGECNLLISNGLGGHLLIREDNSRYQFLASIPRMNLHKEAIMKSCDIEDVVSAHVCWRGPRARFWLPQVYRQRDHSISPE